jgi:hypothetical protein
MGTTAPPPGKILTITIDSDTADPLTIVYKIGTDKYVTKQLTGIKTTDDTIVNEIFSTFLKDSTLMSKYTEIVSNLQPLESAVMYIDFDTFANALGDLSDDDRVIFNTKALEAVFDYIKSTNRPALREKSYFTENAIKLLTNRTRSERLFGAYSSTIIDKINEDIATATTAAATPAATPAAADPHTDTKFLGKYLNVKYWVSQFYVWLREFRSDPNKALSKPAFYKNNDFRIRGGKKTQNNNKTAKIYK